MKRHVLAPNLQKGDIICNGDNVGWVSYQSYTRTDIINVKTGEATFILTERKATYCVVGHADSIGDINCDEMLEEFAKNV